MVKWLLMIASSILAYSVCYLLLYALLKNRMQITARLNDIKDIGSSPAKEKARHTTQSPTRFAFLRIPQDLKGSIALSGIKMNSEEFVLFWIFCTLAPGALVFSLFGGLLRSMALILIGVLVPPIYLKVKIGQRRALFEQQLGDALLVISNALRAGFSFTQALGNAANTLPAPVGTEFRTATREMQFGVDVETSLNGIADRMASNDLRLLTTAIVVQQQVGGNLSEIIDTISKTIRDRLAIKRSVKTLTAQGRISGKVIGALPLVIMLAVSVLNPEYMAPMFSTLFGRILLCVGAIMEIIGFFLIQKVVDIKF